MIDNELPTRDNYDNLIAQAEHRLAFLKTKRSDFDYQEFRMLKTQCEQVHRILLEVGTLINSDFRDQNPEWLVGLDQQKVLRLAYMFVAKSEGFFDASPDRPPHVRSTSKSPCL